MIEVKHVAFFMPELRFGGVEVGFLRLAEGMAARGYRVDLVVANGSAHLGPEVPDGVNLVDLSVQRVLGATIPLARFLRAARPAVLVSGQDHANVVAVWSRSIARVPLVLILTTHSPIRSNTEGRRGITGRALPTAIRTFYPKADAVVAVSDNVACDLAAVVPRLTGQLVLIPNPSIPAGLPHLMAEPTGHPWLDEPSGPPVVLAVGRLDEVKDYPTLLRAFAMVVSSRPARLVVLGDGPERSRLSDLAGALGISANVALVGDVANPFAYYSKAAVLAIASRYEAGPMVLIEALAACLPAVSTDCSPLVRQLLAESQLGRIVPTANPELLADAILNVIDLGRTINRPVELLAAYTVAAAVTRYLELFESARLAARSAAVAGGRPSLSRRHSINQDGVAH